MIPQSWNNSFKIEWCFINKVREEHDQIISLAQVQLVS